jgi:hypothetical protein
VLIGCVKRRDAFDWRVGIAVEVAAQRGDDVGEANGAHRCAALRRPRACLSATAALR